MLARIMGTGMAIPKLRVTNDDLAKIMDTSDEWITERTGVKARHLAVEEGTSSLAIEACKKALDNAGMDAHELDLIIAATVTPDHLLPFLSGEVQAGLDAMQAAAFDMVVGCSGYLYAISVANAYVKSGMYRNILIFGAETLSRIMNWEDRSSCILFGDGAGATVIKASEEGVICSVLGTDGKAGPALGCEARPLQNPYVHNEWDYPYVKMAGQEVYKFAVRTVPRSINEVLDKAGISADEIKYFVIHQANLRMIEAIAKRLGQSMDKFPACIQETGNVSAASIPMVLDKINREGKLERGDKLVFAGFGAGLTWGASVLTW
ncbi:MAG: ketoacyl-ACP synthase III [Lachnospiraceae bacterium]|nr:ketoacyl-ACP synthase III [Lachnospiraceae bacterium]